MGHSTFIVSSDQMDVTWKDSMETLTGHSKREAIGTRNYQDLLNKSVPSLPIPVSYTHLRAHETPEHLVCRLLLEKKKTSPQHLTSLYITHISVHQNSTNTTKAHSI